jgi:hypothetical protein
MKFGAEKGTLTVIAFLCGVIPGYASREPSVGELAPTAFSPFFRSFVTSYA